MDVGAGARVGRLGDARAGRGLHVEARGLPWLILSALHGLVEPDAVLEPYDVTMAQTKRESARQNHWPWTGQGYLCGVRGRLLSAVWSYAHGAGRWERGTPVVVEVHAGALYVEAVRLANAYPDAITVEAPLAGLEIGERLRWYAERRAPMLFPALAAVNQTGLCVA